MKRWIKHPNPGQFRGDGDWHDFDETTVNLPHEDREKTWEYFTATGYLPVQVGADKPTD